MSQRRDGDVTHPFTVVSWSICTKKVSKMTTSLLGSLCGVWKPVSFDRDTQTGGEMIHLLDQEDLEVSVKYSSFLCTQGRLSNQIYQAISIRLVYHFIHLFTSDSPTKFWLPDSMSLPPYTACYSTGWDKKSYPECTRSVDLLLGVALVALVRVLLGRNDSYHAATLYSATPTFSSLASNLA